MDKHVIKGILLPLDITVASLAAKTAAIALGKKLSARVSALAVVDPDVVAKPEATPIGAYSYKQRKDKVLIERARAAASELAEQFTREAEAAGVGHEAKVVVEDPLVALFDSSVGNDVVVSGFDTSFGASPEGSVSGVLEHFLQNNPRPIVVVRHDSLAAAGSVVAFDGTVAAMRALQLFCLTRIEVGPVAVVTVSENKSAAEALSVLACGYLQEHGYSATPHPVQSSAEPGVEILAVAKKVDADLIVAGARIGPAWRKWFRGSTTRYLLANSGVALFLHH